MLHRDAENICVALLFPVPPFSVLVVCDVLGPEAHRGWRTQRKRSHGGPEFLFSIVVILQPRVSKNYQMGCRMPYADSVILHITEREQLIEIEIIFDGNNGVITN